MGPAPQSPRCRTTRYFLIEEPVGVTRVVRPLRLSRRTKEPYTYTFSHKRMNPDDFGVTPPRRQKGNDVKKVKEKPSWEGQRTLSLP